MDAICEKRRSKRRHTGRRNNMRCCLPTAYRARYREKRTISQLNLRANNIGLCVHRPSEPSSILVYFFFPSKCQAMKRLLSRPTTLFCLCTLYLAKEEESAINKLIQDHFRCSRTLSRLLPGLSAEETTVCGIETDLQPVLSPTAWAMVFTAVTRCWNRSKRTGSFDGVYALWTRIPNVCSQTSTRLLHQNSDKGWFPITWGIVRKSDYQPRVIAPGRGTN